VARQAKDLRLYGALSSRAPLAWPWVEQQLIDAGTYWVVARTPGYPHPRPVWGIWTEQQLYLSIGSPTLVQAIRAEPVVTVHLDSGTDVVIVEGLVTPSEPTPAASVQAYNHKYDWDYDASRYGALTRVRPSKVLAWRTTGPAGRDSFQTTGSWIFDDPR
jgi:hypothetical protein